MRNCSKKYHGSNLSTYHFVIRCNDIKRSQGLHVYLRIILQMGNLMNNGVADKHMVYGFSMESLSLLGSIKDMSGQKTLAMFLYEYAYNHYKEEVSGFEKELSILKTAVRLESAQIENSIKAMDEEFASIDQLCQHLQDEYALGDTQKFRDYMRGFIVNEGAHMKMLSIKFRGAQTMASNVARYYGIELEEGKPENLFKR